jgi:A/G-specific adenine glycosylase
MIKENDFKKKLLKWNRDLNKRSMPWKGEADPYRIWLSEIILQQTRVEQGTAYYEKFIAGFPTVMDLAGAREKDVFKYWEGLGYYSRCRNLIATAKKIARDYRGIFPSSYPEILALPGIGPYTAAAIASFAFGLPYAVVDGNVERVLSRYFGINTPVNTSAGKKLYAELASELLDKTNPSVYNQAIMDFGATICKPKNPLCSVCVQSKQCQAFQNNWIGQLPLKSPAPARRARFLYYFIAKAGKNKLWIRERGGNDIWQNLYEFVLWETGQIVSKADLVKTPFFRDTFGKTGNRIREISPAYRQHLTHQTITGFFIHLEKPLSRIDGYQPVALNRLGEFPFPKLIGDYINNNILPTAL